MTNTSSTQNQASSFFVQRMRALSKRLTEPTTAVSGVDFQKVQLFSSLLLLFIPLGMAAFGLALMNQNRTPRLETTLLLYLILASILLLIAVFSLNRTKYYGLASVLLVGVFSGGVLVTAWVQQDPTNLFFLAVGILVSSIFQSWRGTLFLLAAILVGMYLLSLFVPSITPNMIVERLFFVITIGTIAMFYTAIQQQNIALIEKRSSVLAESEQALREARDKLELRVQERTTELKDANVRLQVSVAKLEQSTRDTALLAKMGDLLQASVTTEDASRAIELTIPQLFPDTSGGLFVYSASRDDLETVFTWGLPSTELNLRTFEPDKCWALRRGSLHRMEGLCTALPCHDMPEAEHILCVPMMAYGEALGVLHLRVDKSSRTPPDSEKLLKEQLAIPSAEQIALSLANLNLRQTLSNQAIRDPLTGLFNRRYMEETLERERQRAARRRASLGVIMLDLDHFKNFNDTFGHDAGDAVLQELGLLLRNHVRGSDIACRYGGEEFVLILPEAPLDIVLERAEMIRSKVKKLSVYHRGQSLGQLSMSIGVALFPQHETSSVALLRSADQALYKAKNAGRDQVVIAGSD